MTAFLIIFTALVSVGLVLYLHHRLTGGPDNVAADDSSTTTTATDTDTNEVCCGAHAICERSLPPAQPIYFDDEDLDRFAGRNADDYLPEEIDEFSDVMVTLLPVDIVPWTQSIEQRGIELPSALRDELLMLISDSADTTTLATSQTTLTNVS
jgi:hypothetical protein